MTRRLLIPAVSLLLFLACSITSAQTSASLIVPQGTPIQARLQQQVSSRTATAGEAIKMEALTDLVVDGRVIVRKGAPLSASLTAAKKSAKRGTGGRLTLHIADVQMANGQSLPLDTTQAESGGGPGSKTYKTLVFASVILISPAGITAALLLHGQEVVLPEGTEIAAHVGAATTLDAGSFDRTATAGQAQTTQLSGKAAVGRWEASGRLIDKAHRHPWTTQDQSRQARL
jgi:hypothetical protein